MYGDLQGIAGQSLKEIDGLSLDHLVGGSVDDRRDDAYSPRRDSRADGEHKVPALALNASTSMTAPQMRLPGAKRSPAELAALIERIGAYIKANPGYGVEAIGSALGMPTSDLVLPIKKLIAAKRVRTKGQKRATKYYHT